MTSGSSSLIRNPVNLTRLSTEFDLDATRFNDGRTDRQGWFWAGSMVIDVKAEPRKIRVADRLHGGFLHLPASARQYRLRERPRVEP